MLGHGPMPLPLTLLAIADFCLSLTKKKRFTRKPEPLPEINLQRIEDIYASHQGMQYEEIEIQILDPVYSKLSYKKQPGDPLYLRYENGNIYLIMNAVKICAVYPRYGSALKYIFENNLPFEAYLKSRAFKNKGIYDFFTIVIFF